MYVNLKMLLNDTLYPSLGYPLMLLVGHRDLGSLFRVDEPVTVILYITGRRHKVQMGTTIIPTHTNPFSRGS